MRWLLGLASLLLASCAQRANSPEEQARQGRARAMAVCSRLCDHSRAIASRLVCEPPPVGCEESCLLALPSSAVRCMDAVEAHARCLTSVPASEHVCSRGDRLKSRERSCLAEGQAVTACSQQRGKNPQPARVFPSPPPVDPSRPDQLFCTTFPGAEPPEINAYMRRQAEPAGWMFDSIRPQAPDSVFCFRPIPPGAM